VTSGAASPASEVLEQALHRAARVEDAVYAYAQPRMRRRGWHPTVIPYAGYGGPDWVRVMARVLLSRADRRRRSTPSTPAAGRGWRAFTTLPVKDAEVVIDAGGRQHVTRTDRAGYVDVVVEADLAPGWATVRLSSPGAPSVDAPVRIIGPNVELGLLSDIDDTVMVTALPRPLLAAWNTFVLNENARAPVAGMAVLYERLVNAHPGTPVFYLSTGAWNVAPTLTRFLARHLYPSGPLLLTDWGPTTDRWFRSGPEHKRASLARLAREFPHLRWVLVGDDGQHDVELYGEFAASHADNVAAVVIRNLSPTQAVLAHGLPGAPAAAEEAPSNARPPGVRWLEAPHGAGLASLLTDAGLL
jgi:phosphatidate phosphatase APP1